MEFSVNHPLLYILAGLLVAVVLGQSVFFLIKALRRSKELGMDQGKIRKTVVTAAIFTLSLGSIDALTAQQYVNIVLVMTISILVGIWLVPVISKKLLGGMSNLSKRDAKWAEIFSNAMFIGMIAAFLGFVFCDVSRLWTAENGLVTITVKEMVDGVQQTVEKQVTATSGLTPVAVMATSAVTMALCGLLMKKLNWKWLNDYALPIALVAGMAAAIPITAWLG